MASKWKQMAEMQLSLESLKAKHQAGKTNINGLSSSFRVVVMVSMEQSVSINSLFTVQLHS